MSLPEEKIQRVERFDKIYLNQSSSGCGSFPENTNLFRDNLNLLIKKYNIKSILDLACGNFICLKDIVINNPDIRYIGADISNNIIEDNKKKYPEQSFICLDAITDDLSKFNCDLIIFRHVIQHLNFKNANLAINNIYKSNCKFLLINHQKGISSNNDNKIKEIHWANQAYNLYLPPFNLKNKELECLIDNDKHVFLHKNHKERQECFSLFSIKK